MHIKRFEAPTLKAAVQKVKDEFGPDALVLSQRTLKKDRGWFGGAGEEVVELTAAVDRDVRRANQPEPEAPAPQALPNPSWREFQATKALVDPLEEELKLLRDELRAVGAALRDRREVESDLKELRLAAAELRREAALQHCESFEGELVGRLLAGGISTRHAFGLARAAGDRVRENGEKPLRALRQVLIDALDRKLVPARPDAPTQAELLIGAPGVGKTTSLAKLAGGYFKGHGPLELISTDTLRLGADAQLRAHAQSLSLPFFAAKSATDLQGERVIHPDRRLLVDTAGRSPSDPVAIADLVNCRASLGPRARVHLVLSATTKSEDLVRQLQRYAALRPDGLIATRLDESADVGNLVDVLLRPETPPLFFVANGQRVPEDLAIPQPEWFASRVLGIAA